LGFCGASDHHDCCNRSTTNNYWISIVEKKKERKNELLENRGRVCAILLEEFIENERRFPKIEGKM